MTVPPASGDSVKEESLQSHKEATTRGEGEFRFKTDESLEMDAPKHGSWDDY